MISLRQLRYFRGIATEGSLSAAARSLGVAQPALSYHLGELEQDLGITLVERSNRGVRLTDAGRRLWAHADELVVMHIPQGDQAWVIQKEKELKPKA